MEVVDQDLILKSHAPLLVEEELLILQTFLHLEEEVVRQILEAAVLEEVMAREGGYPAELPL